MVRPLSDREGTDGAALLTWMAIEIAIVGYANAPPLQATYLAVGGAIVLVGIRWQRIPPPAYEGFLRSTHSILRHMCKFHRIGFIV